MAYDFSHLRNPVLKRVFEAIFNATSGHDHDGVNSKLVSAGAPAAGAISADAAGRAMMAADLFDAATVLAKFAADSFDNAQLLKAVKDGAFNADAGTRALFDDGIWNLAKLAATAKTHMLTYQIEDLGAGVDIADRVLMVVPAGLALTVTSANMIPLGTGAGIDDSNNCLVGIKNGANSIAYVAYDTAPGFPAAGTANSLGALSETYKVLAAGEKLVLDVTNGATANPPSMMLQVTYTLADA